MSRILYDFVFTVYDIVEKPTISHTMSGGGEPRRVLILLYPGSFCDIVDDIVPLVTISYTMSEGGGTKKGFETAIS